MKTKLLLIFTFIFFSSSIAFSQSSGDTYYGNKDYFNAVKAYENEVASNPSKYQNLAKSYFALKQYDKALKAMYAFKAKSPSSDMTYANKFIELFERNDDQVSITNVGTPINSTFDELVPRISSDGKKLFFKSVDRTGGKGEEDIWVSNKNSDGSWGAPVPMTQLNTSSNEALYSISSDENVAILFGNYDGTFGNGDLFYSTKTNKGWTMPCNLGGAVNSKDWEAQATLTADGRTLLFVAQRSDALGEYDIYVTHLTDDKGWTVPINVGSGINTKGSETRPSIAPDGKTLYFASTGYFSFGGTDIYMARRLDESWTKWSTPVNLGKYINTLEDDEDFSVPASGIYGYTAKANLPGGNGKFDIYQFILPMSLRPMEVITVFGTVTNDKDSAVGALIAYYDMATGEKVTNAVSSANDGKYVVSLAPGKKYKVVFDMKGYIYYSEVLDLTDPSVYKSNAGFQSKLRDNSYQIGVLNNRLDSLNKELKIITQSNSTDVSMSFTTMGKITTGIKETTEQIEQLYLASKYNWLTEENKLANIERNYKLNRIKVGVTFELKNIFFESGKAALKDESKIELDKLYEILAKNEIGIELGGHTDSIGSGESNMKLSQDRVNSVRDYLVGKGMAGNRITAVGYGEDQPIAANYTEEGRAKNRRVEVKITSVSVNGMEGSNVVTADMDKKQREELERQRLLKEKEDLSKVDMTALLQVSAKKGGLPSDCRCNSEILYLDTYNPTAVNTQQGYITPKKSKSSSNSLDYDNFFMKSFGIHAANFGIKPTGLVSDCSAGVGVTWVNEDWIDDGLLESNLGVFFYDKTKTDPSKIVAFDWNQKVNAIVSNNVGIVMGYNSNLHLYKPNSLVDTTAAHIGIGIPLGIRYFGEYESLIWVPELLYTPYWQTKRELADGTKVDGGYQGYVTLGLNARWKFLQAGGFLNFGKYYSYPGFRLGFTF